MLIEYSIDPEWTPIQQALSATLRVCTYDRAGYGWSEPGPHPRDGARVVAELLLDPQQYATSISEMEQIPKTFEQASQLQTTAQLLPGWLLIVLTAGKMDAPGSTPFNIKPMAVRAEQIKAQGRLADLSSRGEQRVIQESGHLMHLDAPQAIVQAILDVVNAVRNA